MKTRIRLFFLALAVGAAPSALQAQTNLFWDTSATAGIQNGNGTWGTDNFWTTNGTTLTAWGGLKADSAFFGGDGTLVASPAGNFIITVDGTQEVNQIVQDLSSAGDFDFTFTGGQLNTNAVNINANNTNVNSMTVSSVLVDNGGSTMTFSLRNQFKTITLGGNNTFAQNVVINGTTSGGGKLLLNDQNALGSGTTVTFNHGSHIDLNGYSISGKEIVNNRNAALFNTGATKSVWSGNVSELGTNRLFTAGGTGAEVEVSGDISGATHSVRAIDNGVLRLSGNNTYAGQTILRPNSTLIVDNANALGSTSGAFIDTGATLDLNGVDVGNKAVDLQKASSKLVNNNASSAANVNGNIELQTSGYLVREIGGAGNLTLGGVISGNDANAGFTKVGTGTLTLSGSNTYTGQTAVNAGSLLVNGDQSAAVGAVTVASGGTLGGTGTLGGATDISGILAPGAGGIGTLSVANDVTWNGGQSWLFDLGVAGVSIGSPGTSDLLSITGNNDFLKGTGSSWTFDFAGSGDLGWYKLADWTGGTSGFTDGDFTATNLGGGYTGAFTIQNDGLYIQVVPEPSSVALFGGFAAGAWGLRYRRRAARRW